MRGSEFLVAVLFRGCEVLSESETPSFANVGPAGYLPRAGFCEYCSYWYWQ